MKKFPLVQGQYYVEGRWFTEQSPFMSLTALILIFGDTDPATLNERKMEFIKANKIMCSLVLIRLGICQQNAWGFFLGTKCTHCAHPALLCILRCTSLCYCLCPIDRWGESSRTPFHPVQVVTLSVGASNLICSKEKWEIAQTPWCIPMFQVVGLWPWPSPDPRLLQWPLCYLQYQPDADSPGAGL